MINDDDFKPHMSVGAIIKDKEERILMLYHKKYNLWTIPIGKVKQDEHPDIAVARELNEEIGIYRVYVNGIIDNCVASYTLDGVDIISESRIYEVNSYCGSIYNKEPDKHTEIQFMSIEEIMKLRDENNIGELTKKYLELLETKE